MALIVQSVVGDKALQLGREEFIRKFSFGSNWTHLRLVTWLSIPAAVTITGSPVFTIGVCQGNQGLRAGSTTDAVAAFLPSAGANWTYVGAVIPYFTAGTGGYTLGQRIGTTLTSQTNNNTTGLVSAVPASPTSIHLDLVRNAWTGVTTIALTLLAPTSVATAGTAPVYSSRLVSAEWERVWVGGSVEVPYVSSPGSQYTTFTFSGPGLWDSVTVSWSHDSPPIEINDLIAVRYMT